MAAASFSPRQIAHADDPSANLSSRNRLSVSRRIYGNKGPGRTQAAAFFARQAVARDAGRFQRIVPYSGNSVAGLDTPAHAETTKKDPPAPEQLVISIGIPDCLMVVRIWIVWRNSAGRSRCQQRRWQGCELAPIFLSQNRNILALQMSISSCSATGTPPQR